MQNHDIQIVFRKDDQNDMVLTSLCYESYLDAGHDWSLPVSSVLRSLHSVNKCVWTGKVIRYQSTRIIPWFNIYSGILSYVLSPMFINRLLILSDVLERLFGKSFWKDALGMRTVLLSLFSYLLTSSSPFLIGLCLLLSYLLNLNPLSFSFKCTSKSPLKSPPIPIEIPWIAY